jgi:hypothetical protein
MAVKKKSDTISTLPFKAISVLLELSSSIVVKAERQNAIAATRRPVTKTI